MAKFTPGQVDTPWYRLEVSPEDWRSEPPLMLRRMLEQLFVIRRFEETILELHAAGLVHGPAHSSIGQDGGAVGAMSVLRSGDKINGTHRAHHQFLAKFLNHATPADYDPASHEFHPDMHEMVRRSMAEIMGLRPGFCGGRGGSMHMRHDEAGVLGTNAIVGGNLPQAAGYAFADRLLGTGFVTVAFFGDGAMQNAAAYESMNLAALYDLPLIFYLENNQYAVSTSVRESTREVRLASRGPALGIPTIEVDGMDVLAVRKAMKFALHEITAKRGPVLLVAETYRFFHQQGKLPGSAYGYRQSDEEEAWLARDPVRRFPATLADLGVADQDLAKALDARASEIVAQAAASLTERTPEASGRRIVPALWPDPAEAERGIRGDLSELRGQVFREIDSYGKRELREARYVDCIGATLLRNMQRDPRIVALGEDVHRLRGGTFGGTRGAVDSCPERIFATPIAENGFVGLALGASQNGLRPVVEVMYSDFCLGAADQLFNQIAKVRHMFGGNHAVPLVLRCRVAAGSGYGSQHSMDASGLFALFPGWRIVAPATPFDYVGLVNTALRCNDPVMVVEHQQLFTTRGPVPEADHDYCIPFGKARIVRPGRQCTVLAWSAMLPVCLDAVRATGVDAEIIDLRTIDPPGIDWSTVTESVRRTRRVLIAEQTALGTSIGARIAHEVEQCCFDVLDRSILRVTGRNCAPVVSKLLEQASLAGLDEVCAALRALNPGA